LPPMIERSASAETGGTNVSFHCGDYAKARRSALIDFNLSRQIEPVQPKLTIAVVAAGRLKANLTLTGSSTADLTNGKRTISFRPTSTTNGVAGSACMVDH
jgi:hypothetical protein